MNSGQRFVTKDDHQLLAVQLVPNNSLHSVSVEGKWFEYDTGSRVLHQSSAQTLLLPCSAASAKILGCENVVNAVTGENVPYVIVAAKLGDPGDPDYSITLFVLGAKKKLHIAAQTFFVPSFCTFEYGTDVLTVLQSSVRIVDGPTVLFLSENNGCFHFIYRICSVGSSHSITSELDHYTGKIKYSELPPSKNEESNDTSYNCHRFLSANVKFSHWHRTTILTLHSISTTKPTQNKNVPFSLVQSTIKITDGGKNIEHETTLSDLIPDVYASICTSVLSIQNSRCHSFQHEEVPNDAGNAATKDTIICTKFGQMVQFCYNHLFSCQEIPAKDIQRMIIVDAFDNEYVAAVSQKNGVIAAKLEDLKPCGHWSTAKYIVVGDFLRNGTDQLLLLPSSWWRESDTISSFCLTDFGFCHVDTLDNAEIMGEPMEDGDCNNLGMIVDHLESRVQCGMMALHDSENLCHKKMDLAQKTTHSLCSMAIGGSSMPDHNHNNTSNMVDLFSDRANHVTATPSYVGNTDHRLEPFDVAETWQRIVGNKWIVGVDVINRTQRDISEICLSLVQDSTHVPTLNSHSKVQKSIRATNNTKEAEPNSKRRKVVPSNGQPYSVTAPGEEDIVTLTTVTDLPKFTFPMISCQLLLQWSFTAGLASGGPQNGAGDACQPHTTRPSQWVCGQISLRAEDVVSEKFNVKLAQAPQEVCEVRRILQCLNSCQLETSLQLQSSFLSNATLISALQRFGLTFHKMYHSYIDLELGMFYLLRVDLETKGEGQGLLITVHSNDENQLMMFIHMLYSGLPDDLNIVHAKRGNMAATIATALNHMVQEVNQSCHSIGNVLKSTGQADAMEFDQDSSDKTVTDIRQNFELKKRKFMEDDVKPSATQPVLRFPHLQSLTDGSVSHMVKESESF